MTNKTELTLDVANIKLSVCLNLQSIEQLEQNSNLQVLFSFLFSTLLSK